MFFQTSKAPGLILSNEHNTHQRGGGPSNADAGGSVPGGDWQPESDRTQQAGQLERIVFFP